MTQSYCLSTRKVSCSGAKKWWNKELGNDSISPDGCGRNRAERANTAADTLTRRGQEKRRGRSRNTLLSYCSYRIGEEKKRYVF